MCSPDCIYNTHILTALILTVVSTDGMIVLLGYVVSNLKYRAGSLNSEYNPPLVSKSKDRVEQNYEAEVTTQ